MQKNLTVDGILSGNYPESANYDPTLLTETLTKLITETEVGSGVRANISDLKSQEYINFLGFVQHYASRIDAELLNKLLHHGIHRFTYLPNLETHSAEQEITRLIDLLLVVAANPKVPRVNLIKTLEYFYSISPHFIDILSQYAKLSELFNATLAQLYKVSASKSTFKQLEDDYTEIFLSLDSLLMRCLENERCEQTLLFQPNLTGFQQLYKIDNIFRQLAEIETQLTRNGYPDSAKQVSGIAATLFNKISRLEKLNDKLIARLAYEYFKALKLNHTAILEACQSKFNINCDVSNHAHADYFNGTDIVAPKSTEAPVSVSSTTDVQSPLPTEATETVPVSADTPTSTSRDNLMGKAGAGFASGLIIGTKDAALNQLCSFLVERAEQRKISSICY